MCFSCMVFEVQSRRLVYLIRKVISKPINSNPVIGMIIPAEGAKAPFLSSGRRAMLKDVSIDSSLILFPQHLGQTNLS